MMFARVCYCAGRSGGLNVARPLFWFYIQFKDRRSARNVNRVLGGLPDAFAARRRRASMNKGTVRVLKALNLFAQQPIWGVSELSRELSCSKNSAFQALDTLLKEGYLVRSSSGPRYQLAHSVLNFGVAAESTDVRSLCHPYMQRIHELTSESVFLAILVGRSCFCIDSIQTQGVSVGYSPLSQPLPLHAGAGARMLLACLKDEEIERYIALESPLRAFSECNHRSERTPQGTAPDPRERVCPRLQQLLHRRKFSCVSDHGRDGAAACHHHDRRSDLPFYTRSRRWPDPGDPCCDGRAQSREPRISIRAGGYDLAEPDGF
jgi:DNA-binding IclR family transcriptional regulator